MPEPQRPRLTPDNPWPGLSAFGEEDQEYFHGRDRELIELARLVKREPLTVLFGRSGLGKTSLLNAGLFPLLRADNHLPVYIRLAFGAHASLADQVRGALTDAAAAASIEAPPSLGGTLWEWFHRTGATFWNPRNRPVTPVLVFDQFEEMFTLGQGDEDARRHSEAFLSELADLIENRVPDSVTRLIEEDPSASAQFEFERRGYKVVLSFREDFLASMEGLKGQIPSLMRNRYRLEPMDGGQALDVIVRSGGRLVDDDVARRIIGLAWRNVAEPPPTPAEFSRLEIDPALLSVISSEINLKRQRAGRERITADLLEGAEHEILTDFYERALAGLDPRVRAFVEDELITDRGYRDSFALEDAIERPGVSQQAIDQLIGRRLLRVDERLGVRRLELTHDVLTRVVKESRDSRKAREAEAAAAAREAEAGRQKRRNRRAFAVVLVGAVLVVLTGARVFILQKEVTRKTEEAKSLATQAGFEKARADQQTEHANKQTKNANRLLQEATAANKAAEDAQAGGRTAGSQAQEATARARTLTREARATDLIINARNVRSDFLDRALLVGAEAIREHPHRLEALVDQLGRLLANPQLALLLRDNVYAFSPDSRMLAAGSSDGTVTLWSTETWRMGKRWQGHAAAVKTLVFSSDSTRVASSDGESLALWSAPEGRELHRRQVPEGDADRAVKVRRLLWGPDGASVVLDYDNGTVRLWRSDARDSAAQIDTVYRSRTGGPAECVGFSADGKTLMVVGGDQLVRWSIVEGKGEPTARGRDRALGYRSDCSVAVISIRHDGGGHEFQLRELWGARDPRAVKLNGVPERVSFSPDGRLFAAAAGAGNVDVWDAESAKQRRGMTGLSGPVDDIVFGPGGKILSAVLRGGTVIAREWESGFLRLTARFPRRQVPGTQDGEGVGGLLYSPDGKTLVAYPLRTDGGGRLTAVWTLERGELLTEANGTPHRSEEIEFNRSGDTLASSGNSGGAYFWDASNKALRWQFDSFIEAEFSPDGTRVAVARKNNTIEILDAIGKSREATVPVSSGRRVSSLAFSGNNHRLGIGFTDGSVAVYDLKTRPPTPIRDVAKQHPRGARVAFSPDGRTLASGGSDGCVVLWHAPDGRTVRLEGCQNGAVLRMAFSPDGKLLAAGSEDRSVALHDVGGKGVVARFEPHYEAVGSVVFIDGGKALVSGGVSGWREVWDVPARRWLATLRNSPAGGSASSVAVSPQGWRMAVLHPDGYVTLRNWDPATLVRDGCRIANRNLSCVEWRQYLGDLPYRKTCDDLPPGENCH